MHAQKDPKPDNSFHGSYDTLTFMLHDKLKIPDQANVYFYNCPLAIKTVLTFPEPNFRETKFLNEDVDFVLCFVTHASELNKLLDSFSSILKKTAIIWIAWPNPKSNLPTDLNDKNIRLLAQKIKLNVTKITSIDNNWAGLKLIRGSN